MYPQKKFPLSAPRHILYLSCSFGLFDEFWSSRRMFHLWSESEEVCAQHSIIFSCFFPRGGGDAFFGWKRSSFLCVQLVAGENKNETILRLKRYRAFFFFKGSTVGDGFDSIGNQSWTSNSWPKRNKCFSPTKVVVLLLFDISLIWAEACKYCSFSWVWGHVHEKRLAIMAEPDNF